MAPGSAIINFGVGNAAADAQDWIRENVTRHACRQCEAAPKSHTLSSSWKSAPHSQHTGEVRPCWGKLARMFRPSVASWTLWLEAEVDRLLKLCF